MIQHQNSRMLALQRLSTYLWQDRSPFVTYGVALILAALFISQRYPLQFLLGHGAFLEEGDAAAQAASWLFYMHDAWHFPLLHTTRLGHPEGVNIAFADSIPLAALFFKLIRSWLPPQFHYIGLWHAVSFATQAVAACFLIRSLGQRHILATLAAVLFCLTWPALLWRMGHAALMTHALILFSLAFYFLGRQGHWSSSKASTAFIILNLVGLMIHPYFLAFCFPLFLAFLADQAIAAEGWKKQLPRLFISIAVIVLAGVLFGYFGQATRAGGFGVFSMNLVAPFCGVEGQFFSCFVDATGGQGEGYNYLGAGLFLLIPFAVVAAWPGLKAISRRYPAMLVVLLLFTVYAASTRVYAGSHEIFSYALPRVLTDTFRASGRFFWVPGYVILFSTLVVLLRKPAWRSVVLVTAALAIQWTDLASLRAQTSMSASAPGKQDLAQWESVMTGVEKIHVFPAFGCGQQSADVYWHFQRVAGHFQKLLDTGYMARQATNCADNERSFHSAFQPRHLYVMPAKYKSEPLKIPAGFKEALQRGECATWRESILCQVGMRPDQWKNSLLSVNVGD